ncbi:probable ubiquitin-conjugating enzyme E2 23 [Andrographis paniculata]|uniref:probable ubiquitin-conjugating enzyme E2 23 n=1 Tax=Andrographis paniculata TaxID=175694 RepID=UPI0021E87810|nr:probable ubiquitin-conjugating enzyme E2 23 [Andrographis paniculata]XP_051144478.1 probable ubiquitin-conjugating enzyme E2 23 [Andrographis paniculata]XP_051144479.1 probable ubiquitin-conjugating enzyme E2 23 [Andrographis paniculata]XP_051144480.1 probable ubiquitin-conjugating enzyme E2 23 [Andrographis paniculata]
MECGQHPDKADVCNSKIVNNNASSEQNNSSSCIPNIDPTSNPENNPNEALKNLKNVLDIYRQDVVRSKSNNEIGIVTEVAGDSDSDSSITDDEDEEEDEDEYENEKDDEAASSEESHADNGQKLNESAAMNVENNDGKHNPLNPGQLRVLWMNGSETTESANGITVVDRGFLHGDYVASATDPTGQIGLVIDVNINVDLLAHDGSVIKDIPSRDLRRIRDFTVGDHIVLGPWLGRIEDVFDNVTVQLDDGSVCKVIKADPLHLKPITKNILEDGHFPYYPGQRVKASSSSVFKNSRWLSGLWKANRLEGTVTKVTVGSVLIHWIASAGYGSDSASAPAEEQSPKNLKLLSCFVHANWQLGDWCLLPSTKDSSDTPSNKELPKLDLNDSARDESESMETGDESDADTTTVVDSKGNPESIDYVSEASLGKNVEKSDDAAPAESPCNGSVPSAKEAHETWPFRHKRIRKVVVRKDKKARKKLEYFERPFLIINVRTKVDVAWQDGTRENGIDSASLIPIDSPGDHDFVAEQYVVEKANDTEDSLDTRRVGVVKNVNAKDRTACVRWLKAVTRAEDPREFDKEEVVSVYELEGHPDFDYCYGDVVVRLSPISLPAKVEPFVHSTENMPLNHSEPIHEKERHHERDNMQDAPSYEESSEFSDLSWVGNITGLKDGDIEVTWADGMISTVGPQAIYVVGRDDDDSVADGSYASDDAASWETVEDDAETIGYAEKDVDGGNDVKAEMEDNDIDINNSGKSGALSIPMAAIGFVTKIASGIFSMGRRHLDPSSGSISGDDDLQCVESSQSCDLGDKSSTQKPNGIDNQLSKLNINSMDEHKVSGGSDMSEIIEIPSNLKSPESDGNSQEEIISSFKGFDIVRDPSDHYFLGAEGQNNATRKWLKKVQWDWDILQNNLPEDIYVRAYEDRMDLLRAVIVGAYGTPYQDGLFFFDFHLPPEYPDVPPSAHYHSGGWRINPNLYEEGKVCLSLLNTWTGRGNEVWDPSTSSILQVLVSLQGLVLNSKPYFNEAGYDKQVGTAEGEKNSLSYNENSFILNCKTMMYLMRRPPKDFEELVAEHFRKRGRYILKACDAYMKGHLIGSLAKDASVISDTNNTNTNSVGFKLMLAKIVPKLFTALTEVGAECGEFKHLNSIQL